MRLSSREDILGYSVYRAGVRTCVDEIAESLQSTGAAKWLACLNPHSYAQAEHDSDFSRSLKAADWLIPDGVGIVLASRWQSGDIRERVTGSDIFEGLLRRLDDTQQGSVFFLGSTPSTLEAICARMALDYPAVRVAGVFSPPFKQEFSKDDVEAMIAAINAAKPDVLWVGMTAPKQEKWIHSNLHRLEVRFAGAIGAVFDFYSGRIDRSSTPFQRAGLEWLPRLVQEPRRLWRRMGVSAPLFLFRMLRARRG